MRMYLLDTNVLAELRTNKPRPSAAVRAWARLQPANQLYLSAITVLEFEIGVRRIERKDAMQGAHLRNWAERTFAQFSGRILPISSTTALRCACLHVPNPRPLGDSLIAATALEHSFVMVTRNVKDFAGTGVQIINPWEHEG